MDAEYDVFQKFPKNRLVKIVCISGRENLQRTLMYYAKLSSSELVAINRRTNEVVYIDGSELATPATRVNATAA